MLPYISGGIEWNLRSIECSYYAKNQRLNAFFSHFNIFPSWTKIKTAKFPRSGLLWNKSKA